jgi:hypothetical protein
MGQNLPNIEVRRNRSHEISSNVRDTLIVTNEELAAFKITQIMSMVPSSGVAEEHVNILISCAIELYESLMPTDAIEGMLAEQMLGTHYAGRECLRKANVSSNRDARDMYLKQAEKLMTLYLKQVAALDKHRGKGQPKVTVEHVHVAKGGQAIVGYVEKEKASKGSRSQHRKSVSDMDDDDDFFEP